MNWIERLNKIIYIQTQKIDSGNLVYTKTKLKFETELELDKIYYFSNFNFKIIKRESNKFLIVSKDVLSLDAYLFAKDSVKIRVEKTKLKLEIDNKYDVSEVYLDFNDQFYFDKVSKNIFELTLSKSYFEQRRNAISLYIKLVDKTDVIKVRPTISKDNADEQIVLLENNNNIYCSTSDLTIDLMQKYARNLIIEEIENNKKIFKKEIYLMAAGQGSVIEDQEIDVHYDDKSYLIYTKTFNYKTHRYVVFFKGKKRYSKYNEDNFINTISGSRFYKKARIRYKHLLLLNERFLNYYIDDIQKGYETHKKNTGYMYYFNNLDKYKVDEKQVLIKSVNGNDLFGNMFYIAQKFKAEGYNINVSIRDVEKIRDKIEYYNLDYNFVTTNSIDDAKLMINAKYILTDTSLPFWFIKNEDQVLINTWHGTPLKAMGKNVSGDLLEIRNIQKNYLMADKMLLNNQLTIDTLFNDYMLSASDQRNQYLVPAARNSALTNNHRRKEIRAELGLTDEQKVIVWMPTWRGEGNHNKSIEENLSLVHRFINVVNDLPDNYVVYLKLHQFISQELNEYDFDINLVPSKYEIYDFLAISDCLVTDYSSIMFDYAITNRKIILDIFDLEEYKKSRGFTISIDEIDLLKVETEKDLYNEILSIDEVEDYNNFNQIYNPLENNDILDLNYQEIISEYHNPPVKNKEKILIYPGPLKPGIKTDNVLKFLNKFVNVTDQYEIVLLLPLFSVKPADALILKPLIDQGVSFLATPKYMVINSDERVLNYKVKNGIAINKEEGDKLTFAYSREAKRVLHDINFDLICDLYGYDEYVNNLILTQSVPKIAVVSDETLYSEPDAFKVQSNKHFIKNCDKLLYTNDFNKCLTFINNDIKNYNGNVDDLIGDNTDYHDTFNELIETIQSSE